MAEHKPDPEKFQYDIPLDRGAAEFDPLLANHFELSYRMTEMAGDHNVTDITDDRHLTQWDTNLEDVYCELSAWDFPNEPFYTLSVHSGKKRHIYEYGNYIQGIRYSSGDNSQPGTPDQAMLEAQLTGLLQYGHKQLIEAGYRRTFDEITGRLAMERVLARNKSARRFFHHALARKGFDAIELHLLSTMQDSENWSVRPPVFHKAAATHLQESLDQGILSPSEQGMFRKLFGKLRP